MPTPTDKMIKQLNETTILDPLQEALFQRWATQSGVEDVRDPRSYYDYRGYWTTKDPKESIQFGQDHFPDTYKQHGHPRFSAESRYSRGNWDGGQWIGETIVDPPQPGHKLLSLIDK